MRGLTMSDQNVPDLLWCASLGRYQQTVLRESEIEPQKNVPSERDIPEVIRLKTPYLATFQIALALGVLSLDVMALRGWMKLLRQTLRPWRNILGCTAAILTLLTLTTFFIPLVARLTPFDTPSWLQGVETIIPALIASGILFGCAFERAPRLQIVGANLLLLLLWRTSMVY